MVEKKILKSKEILPTNYRLSHQEISKLNAQYNLKNLDFINTQRLRYHKALEAAEQELLELKDGIQEMKENYTYAPFLLEKLAEERYKEAIAYFLSLPNVMPQKEFSRNIIKALKIAAGI
jgi:hypothetical protein